MNRICLALLLVSAFCCAESFASSDPQRPVKLIFDTDMGNDVDDALAIALLHALQNRGACQLLAITLTNPDPLAGAYIDALNTYYGRGDIPIGVTPNAPQVSRSKFLKLAAEQSAQGAVFPHDFDLAKAPDSVALLRRTLARSENGSVVIVQVGFFTNLAALLASGPDEESELDGLTLVRAKVRLLSVMAGEFATGEAGKRVTEFNVRYDVAAAQKVASQWPTPIVWSGMEIGIAIPLPASAIDSGYDYAKRHLVREAYQLYRPTPHERPTWDLTSVLHAVFPEREYFVLSDWGFVTVEADGYTRFSSVPSTPLRRDRILSVSPQQAMRVKGVFEMLCTEPPQMTSLR